VSQFRSELRIRLACAWANDGTGQWENLAPFLYYSTLLRRVIEIPVGFSFDGASVPKLPMAFALFGGRYWRAALIHDFLCRMRRISREKADLVFLEAMRLENEEEIQAMRAAGMDDDEIAARKANLEGRALSMYVGVAAFTKSGAWKTEVDKPGFEPIL
jgi:hypothetical protein